MQREDELGRQPSGTSRRAFLIGAAGAGGLALAWAVWPRRYTPHLNVTPGEQAIGAFLKIDRTGQITVIVPQAELGQGVYTLLPQLLADELGADWRTVAVQPAVPGPLYANRLLAREWLDGPALRATGTIGDWLVGEYATREALVLTGGSTSLAALGPAMREAGAAARVLLCKAAAARWGAEWQNCDITEGIVSDGTRRARIGELVDDAVGFDVPADLPLRPQAAEEGRLLGSDVPRLDLPAKLDGSANFAADIRLPEMIYAAIRQGPVGGGRVIRLDEAAARAVPGVLSVIRREDWVAVTATGWWAASRGLDRLRPAFAPHGAPLSDAAIGAALTGALRGNEGGRFFGRGDLGPLFDKANLVVADYAVAPALHLAMEPMAATARVTDGGAEIWAASQAPAFTRRAVADALGLSAGAVTLYPLFAGGSFGRKMEMEAAVQAALIAREAKVPVQLMWSRAEDMIHDRPRPPARAHLAARLGAGGAIEGLSVKVAAPAALAQSWRRVGGESPAAAVAATRSRADPLAVSGLDISYDIANFAVDHLPADIALPTGRWRSNADSYGCFFLESFIDELASVAGQDPMTFRLPLLAKAPRLARCLAAVATSGGWKGGLPGSGQGVACHSMAGSAIAVLVEAGLSAGRIVIRKIAATVDCGLAINPDIARQQVEGGLIFGLAEALGGEGRYASGQPTRLRLGGMGLPRLADVGEVTVELIAASGPQSGVGEIGVPPVAPALAGALYTLTGRRWRALPFTTGS